MLNQASEEKILKRIKKIFKNNTISKDISYSVQEKDGIYQCVIK